MATDATRVEPTVVYAGPTSRAVVARAMTCYSVPASPRYFKLFPILSTRYRHRSPHHTTLHDNTFIPWTCTAPPTPGIARPIPFVYGATAFSRWARSRPFRQHRTKSSPSLLISARQAAVTRDLRCSLHDQYSIVLPYMPAKAP